MNKFVLASLCVEVCNSQHDKSLDIPTVCSSARLEAKYQTLPLARLQL